MESVTRRRFAAKIGAWGAIGYGALTQLTGFKLVNAAEAAEPATSGKISEKLAALKIELPQASAPGGELRAVCDHRQPGLHLGPALRLERGAALYRPSRRGNHPPEAGIEAARLCGLNLIAQLQAACGGNLDRVTRVVRLGGFINSVPGFKDQAKVMNGASDLMVQVFGDAGRHARAAVGVSELPFGCAVEADGIFEIRPA